MYRDEAAGFTAFGDALLARLGFDFLLVSRVVGCGVGGVGLFVTSRAGLGVSCCPVFRPIDAKATHRAITSTTIAATIPTPIRGPAIDDEPSTLLRYDSPVPGMPRF